MLKGTYPTVLSFLVAVASLARPALANDFYTLVRYECSQQSDQLTVSYEGERGRARVESAGPDAWNTDDLVILDRKIERRIGHKTIRRECALSSGMYEVVIEGFFWNENPGLECGYRTTAFLRIARSGKNLYLGPFEAHCRELKDIVTKVTVRRDGSAAVTHTTEREFFRW